MTEINSRIEEVKKILTEFDAQKNRAWNKVGCGGTLKEYEAVDEGFARQIDNYYCQLFTQPLDDKELREQGAKWLAAVIENGEPYENFAEMEWSEFSCGLNGEKATQEYREAMLELFDNLYSTLLPPKIEEAKKQCLEEWMPAQIKAEKMIKEEAKREERERIIKVVKMPYGDDSHIVTNSLLLFRKHILNRIGKP